MLSDYLRKRAAHLLPPRDLECLRVHLLDRLARGEKLPAVGRGIDWVRLATEANVDGDLLFRARDALRPGLEALRREIALIPRVPKKRGRKPKNQAVKADPEPQRPRQMRKPRKPIILSPEPDPGAWDDPSTFHEALALHMRRHRDSAQDLCRALLRQDETFETSTIIAWRSGRKAPRSVASLDLLRRIEGRYRLPAGYFQAKLPHPSRATTGHRPAGISPAEMRRLAWHLPDDFADRSATEQEEILEWVHRRVHAPDARGG
jgi:hypothetical protein